MSLNLQKTAGGKYFLLHLYMFLLERVIMHLVQDYPTHTWASLTGIFNSYFLVHFSSFRYFITYITYNFKVYIGTSSVNHKHLLPSVLITFQIKSQKR